jgi:LPXTG-motif cell wall-anchored protein
MTEFDDVIRLLKDERPQATELELDKIKQRVRRRAADPSRRSSQPMKSRIAILGLLVTGMLFSTAGAGLAIQGAAQSGTNAAVSQYATPTPAGEEGGVLPAEEEKAPTPQEAPTGGVLPAEAAQPARQEAAAAQAGQLPFTGFAAIPILLGGLALLTGGLVLRRRTRNE